MSSQTPPSGLTYIVLGDFDDLTLPEALCLTKEESLIKQVQVFCSIFPDTASNRIKGAASVKATWEILNCAYEERSKALMANAIRRFRNKRCEDNESVRSHFEALADLREQLAAMENAVTDIDHPNALLALLPSSYDSAGSTINASAYPGSETLIAEIFEQLIIGEYIGMNVEKSRTSARS